MNIDNFEKQKKEMPSSSDILCYNEQKWRMDYMSSMIVSCTKEEAIIASDSRNTKLNGDFYDNYPKIHIVGGGLVGIVGINTSVGNKEIGELFTGFEPYIEAIKIAEKVDVLENYNTQFIVLRYINGIDCKVIEVNHNKTVTINSVIPTYHAYGVKHCIHTDKFDVKTPLNISVIRNLINIDRNVEKEVRKIPTVGGPIQMYKLSSNGIEDLSDKNAPKDFTNYKKQLV